MGKKRVAARKLRKQKYEYPHVFVATPAYDGKVDCDYSQSLAQAAQAATVYGIRFTASVMANGAFIDLARNMFVKFFLEDKDATHLFFIDSDIKFESRAFVELVRHCTEDRPVVAGMYRKRQEPEDYPCRWVPHPELSSDGIDKLWYDDAGWLKCDRVPTGFLCIRRNIIEEMVKDAIRMDIKGFGRVPRLFYTYLNEDNRFVGEDFAWCDDYMKRYKRPIDVWCDFDFTHGGYEGNYQRWIVDNAKYVGDEKDGGFGILKNDEEPTRSRPRKLKGLK